MRFCEKCNVHIRGGETYCPLCGNRLQGQAEEDIFPKTEVPYQQMNKILRMFLFLSVSAVLICLVANRIFDPHIFWSLFVLFGMASFWISLLMVWKKKQNIPKSILWQTALISLLALIWDVGTGWNRWSIDFVLPILCTVAIFVIVALIKLLHLGFHECVIYILLEILIGVVVLVLLCAGVIHFIYPSLICVLCCGISLSALVIFRWDVLKEELQKRLHF